MIRILCALLLLGVGSARAASLEGVTFPDTYPVDGQVLHLNGLGLRTLTILRVRAYVAGLYVARPTHDEEQIVDSASPKVLIMAFLRSGSKSQVEGQFRQGEKVNCGQGGCDVSDQADFERMIAAAPAVNAGDTFTFELTNHGVRFSVNGRVAATSDKADLSKRILLGFIGEHPPSPELREQLLGESD